MQSLARPGGALQEHKILPELGAEAGDSKWGKTAFEWLLHKTVPAPLEPLPLQGDSASLRSRELAGQGGCRTHTLCAAPVLATFLGLNPQSEVSSGH